jgi:hypothetical protein
MNFNQELETILTIEELEEKNAPSSTVGALD